MGFNGEHAHVVGAPWMVFDIETCPMPGCAEYLTDDIDAPSNYKDPAKIAAYVAEKRAKQIADAGLDLDLCEIVAIGWRLPFVGDGGPSDCTYAQTRETTSETDMLSGFWRFVQAVQRDGGNLVGFNCLSFDLPILLRRSLYLDVPVPKIALDKYRHEGVIDVADVLTFNGRMTWRSLSFYARRFGIPHDDSVKGDQIAALVAAGEWEKVAGHARADVQTTKALAQRIGLIYQAETQPEAVAV